MVQLIERLKIVESYPGFSIPAPFSYSPFYSPHMGAKVQESYQHVLRKGGHKLVEGEFEHLQIGTVKVSFGKYMLVPKRTAFGEYYPRGRFA